MIMYILLSVVFSACGGIRTGIKVPVLTAYFPMLAEGILGKGGLFVVNAIGQDEQTSCFLDSPIFPGLAPDESK